MKRSYLLVLPLLMAAWGCGSIKIRIPAYTVAPPDASPVFLAGVGKVDITPPPGYPLGGHSIGGRMARGYWTRLYARAFYFQDAGGRRLILVSCDLFAIPAGLYAQVAQELQLPPESLIISATHTHHGPAGYMSSAVFNFGGLLPGYDFELARRLKEGIKEAIELARKNAGERGANRIVLRRGFAANLQRNRAIDAFYLNGGKYTDAVLQASRAAGMTCPGGGDECPRYQAADPSLQVLEVLRNGERIGLLVFYAIHNTAMSHNCTLYQSDLSGYAMQLLEEVKRDKPPGGRGLFQRRGGRHLAAVDLPGPKRCNQAGRAVSGGSQGPVGEDRGNPNRRRRYRLREKNSRPCRRRAQLRN